MVSSRTSTVVHEDISSLSVLSNEADTCDSDAEAKSGDSAASFSSCYSSNDAGIIFISKSSVYKQQKYKSDHT